MTRLFNYTTAALAGWCGWRRLQSFSSKNIGSARYGAEPIRKVNSQRLTNKMVGIRTIVGWCSAKVLLAYCRGPLGVELLQSVDLGFAALQSGDAFARRAGSG